MHRGGVPPLVLLLVSTAVVKLRDRAAAADTAGWHTPAAAAAARMRKNLPQVPAIIFASTSKMLHVFQPLKVFALKKKTKATKDAEARPGALLDSPK